jgi:exodeoxyribonuclease V gamma subunit
LPPARHGDIIFAEVVKEVAGFAASLQKRFAAYGTLPSLDIDLVLGDIRLSGRLDHLLQDRMLRYRCAKNKAKDQMRTWLEHLVLNVLGQEQYPHETTLVMLDKECTFKRVDDAVTILSNLFRLYREGLTAPLRFFPAAALEYAKKLEWNLERARSVWQGNDFVPGEGDDPSFRLCFGDDDPFTAEFESISRTIMEPLVRYRSEDKA